jgi:hypothetical protein
VNRRLPLEVTSSTSRRAYENGRSTVGSGSAWRAPIPLGSLRTDDVAALRFPLLAVRGTEGSLKGHSSQSGWMSGGCRPSSWPWTAPYPRRCDRAGPIVSWSVAVGCSAAGKRLGVPARFLSPGYPFLRPVNAASCAAHARHVISWRPSGTRPGRSLRWRDLAPGRLAPRSPCRNGGGETFFPWARAPAQERVRGGHWLAHSSRGKKAVPPPSSAALRP